jgi:hypothetical protein
MRHLSILLFIILCFNACKKSSNNLPITPAALSGTWSLHTATSITYTNGVRSNTSTTTFNNTNAGFSNLDLVIEFNDNLTGTYQQPGLMGFPFTYVISGNQLTWNFDSNVPSSAVTGIPTNFTIKALTNNQLELVYGETSGNGIVYDDIYTKN